MKQEDLLWELVRVNTVDSKNSDRIQGLIEDYLKQQAKVIESNGVKNFIWEKGEGKAFVLSGHYDVVPAPGWDNAFEPYEKDGWLYGRGTADMKGGLSALIEAYRITQPPAGTKLVLAIVGDEEKGGLNGAGVVAEKLNNVAYYLSGESLPAQRFLDIMKVGRRGVLQLYITLKGQGGHGSRPNPKHSPIYFLPTLIAQLEQLRFNDKEDMVPTTVGITNIICDSGAINVHASQCEVWLDIRYNYGNKPEEILEKVEKVVRCWPEYEIKKREMPKPYPFRNHDKEYEKRVQDAFEKYTGIRPMPSTTGGSSDARFFALKGIPVIEAGPRGKNTHAKEERVALEDVLLLPKIYKEII